MRRPRLGAIFGLLVVSLVAVPAFDAPVSAEHQCLQAEGPATAVVSVSIGASDTKYDVGTDFHVQTVGDPANAQFSYYVAANYLLCPDSRGAFRFARGWAADAWLLVDWRSANDWSLQFGRTCAAGDPSFLGAYEVIAPGGTSTTSRTFCRRFAGVGASRRSCFSVAGSLGDVAVVNLTPVEAAGAGSGQLVSSDIVNAPVASNVNFGPGTVDPNVALSRIGADGKVCYINSVHSGTHLVADHLGTVAGSVYTPATASGAPDRKVDTRIGQGGGAVGPSGRLCFEVAGAPGDVAVVNLTPVEAGGGGSGQLVSSDIVNAPVASNVNFGPGTVDPNVALSRIGADGKVCYVNSVHTTVHLIADHLGTVAGSVYTPATQSGAPDRKVDTRIGQGGGAVGPSGRLCFEVAGAPGDVAVVNLTPVEAAGAGSGQLVSSDIVNAPVASNVNFGPGTVDPNVALSRIGADGKVCYVNSVHTTVHLIADHLGTVAGSVYTPATPSGAPERKVDTRVGVSTPT